MARDKNLPDKIDGLTIYEINKANLLDAKDVFDKHDLDCWLIQGTFLGLYRDGDIIPWDNDVDLAIRMEDLDKFHATREDMEELGFRYVYEPSHNILLPKHGGYERLKVSLDVFFFEKKEDKRVCRAIQQITDKAFETYNELEYEGRHFRIFHEPKRWLNYLYNDTWQTPIKDRHAGPEIFGSPAIPNQAYCKVCRKLFDFQASPDMKFYLCRQCLTNYLIENRRGNHHEQ